MSSKTAIIGLLLAVGISLPLIFTNAIVVPHKSATVSTERSIASSEKDFCLNLSARTRYNYNYTRTIQFFGLSNENPAISYQGTFHLDVLTASNTKIEAIMSQDIIEHPQKPTALRIAFAPCGKNLEIFSGIIKNEDEEQNINILKDLLSLWFFSGSVDTVGRYSSSINILSSDSVVTNMKKVKSSYLESPRPTILSSEELIKWSSEKKIPIELKGAENTRLGMGELRAESTFSIKFSGTSQRAMISKQFLGSLNQGQELKLTQNFLSGSEGESFSWMDLRARIDQLNSLENGEQLKLFGDLVKFLKLKPSELANLLAMLDSATIRGGGELFKLLVGTLATVASPEALAALRDIYENPNCSTPSKGVILAAMTTTQGTLDGPTVEFLASEIRSANHDLAYGAIYALGASLQKNNNSSAVEIILQGWAVAKSQEEKLAWLDAMGNSGRSDFLPILQATIKSAETIEVRSKAIFSLRFIEQGTQTLVSALSEPESLARINAVRAMQLATWKEDFRVPLDRCEKTEALDEIKKQCKAVLDGVNL